MAALVLTTGVLRSEENAGGAQVDELVKQLGADEFKARETASLELWKIGNAALPALRKASRSGDPEVAERARKIVRDVGMGILFDTPPETVALIREFHAGEKKQKQTVLRRLRGDDKLLLRIQLLRSEKNPVWRRELIREFAGTGDQILEGLRESAKPGEAEELLAILSPRSWAVHMLYEGEAEATRAELDAGWDEGKGAIDPAQLFWLLIVMDKLEEARKVADQSGLAELQREACLRQDDWSGFLKAGGSEVGSNEVEKLGFKAWFLSNAGEDAKAQAALDALAKVQTKDDRMARNRAMSLLILGRFEDAEDQFAKLGELDKDEFNLLYERFRFDELFERLGVNPAADSIAEELRDRIVKTLESKEGKASLSERREKFYLAKSVADLLAAAGEREIAKDLLLAAAEVVKDDSSYLSYLASTFRRLGFLEEADSIGLRALETGSTTSYLSTYFRDDRAVAQLWWDYFRTEHGDESAKETIQRVTKALEVDELEPFDARIKEIQEWLEKRSEEKRAKHFGVLAAKYGAFGEWETMKEYVRKQVDLSKNRVTPLLEAGHLFADNDRWDDAAAYYAKAVEENAGNEQAIFLHGHALTQIGKHAEGEARKAAALRMPLANAQRRNSLAYALLRRGFKELATEQWQTIVKTAAHDDWDGTNHWSLRTARSRLATESDGKDNPAGAAKLQEAYLMSFLKTNTSSTARNYLLYRTRVGAYRFEASLAEGDLDGAVRHARSALAAWPGHTKLAIKACDELTKAGRPEPANEIYESLTKHFSRALKLFPRSAKHHNSMARIAGLTGRDLKRALSHAESAVELVPDNAEYLDTLAEVNFRLGNREKAIELAKQCLELNPESERFAKLLERFESGEAATTEP